MFVALAGKSCSGKGEAGKIFAELGALHLDLDNINHRILEREKDSLVKIFGSTIIDSNGKLNRSELGRIVFSDNSELEKLENLVHPLIEKEVQDFSESVPETTLIVIDGAVMHKSRLMNRINSLVWVESPLIIRWRRALKRDNRSRKDLIKRFWSQRNLNPQQFLQDVDIYKVYNNGSLPSLREKIRLVFSSLTLKEKK